MQSPIALKANPDGKSTKSPNSDFIDEEDITAFISESVDTLKTYGEELVGAEGMKIDRKFYQSFENKVANDSTAQDIISQGDEAQLEHYLRNNIFDKPAEFFTVDKLERALGLDRRLTIKEIVRYLMGDIDRFKCKQELISDEFCNFQLLNQADIVNYSSSISSIQSLFSAFLTDASIRAAIREKQLQVLINSPLATDLRATKDVRIKGKRLLDYMVDYVAVNDINCERFSN